MWLRGLGATCRPLRSAMVRKTLVEEFVDLATRRLATFVADRTAYGGDEPQLGIDGVEVAPARNVDPRGGVSR